MTNKERIELYKAQRDAAEANRDNIKAIAVERFDRIKLMEVAYDTSKRMEKHLRERINELESALDAIEDREAADADPQLDAYRRGVEDGIERVEMAAKCDATVSACDRALAAFRSERSENQEQTDG